MSIKCLYKKYIHNEMGNLLMPWATWHISFRGPADNWLDHVFLSIAVIWSIIVENVRKKCHLAG